MPWRDPAKSKQQYVDLKMRPGAAAKLDECRRWPPMGTFLIRVNSYQSIWRTAKCDVWATTILDDDERADFGLPCKVGSYVDLLFDQRRLSSSLEPHLQVAARIEAGVAPVRLPAQLEIFLRRCLFHSEELWGYYLTIYTHAYGADPRQARRHWEAALRVLADVLAEIGETCRRAPETFLT